MSLKKEIISKSIFTEIGLTLGFAAAAIIAPEYRDQFLIYGSIILMVATISMGINSNLKD